MTEQADLIGPDEAAFHLELTPPQLKVLHAALRAFLSDFGHDERDVNDVVRQLLKKLPDEQSIRSIDLRLGR